MFANIVLKIKGFRPLWQKLLTDKIRRLSWDTLYNGSVNPVLHLDVENTSQMWYS